MAASPKPILPNEAGVHEPLLRTHMPELDTIRGLAILGVLLYHAFYWAADLSGYAPWQRSFLLLMSPGQFGVNLFFVLSGFLITGILIDSQYRSDYYLRFYFRRALRILPAYYFTLFLLIVFGMTSGGFLLMSLAYCSNLSGLFGIALSYPVLWSLAVEEHFYLVWPAVVRRFDPNKLLWIPGTILVFCPLSRYLYHLHAARIGLSGGQFGYYTWNNADGLALGAVIAILMRRPGWGRIQSLRLSAFAVLLALIIGVVGYPFGIFTRRTAVGEALQCIPWNLGFAALLSLFLLLGTTRWKRAVAPPFLTFFGKISYGLYLYHLMCFSGYRWSAARFHFDALLRLDLWGQIWLRAFVAGGAAVAFSYLSRQYFEEPFLRLKDRLPGILRRQSTAPAPRMPAAPDWIPGETDQEPSRKIPNA